MNSRILKPLALALALAAAACQHTENSSADTSSGKSAEKAEASPMKSKPAKAQPATTMHAPAESAAYGRPGFAVYETEGRLWVFRRGGEAHDEFLAKGEPAERVSLIGVGPNGMTVLGAERESLLAYTAQARYGRPGFEVYEDDGRLWVFRAGGEALAEFVAKGAPAERVTRIGAGPYGMTLMSAENEDLEAFAASVKLGRPGFAVIPAEGRLWVFRDPSAALAEFLEKGPPAERVTLIGRGPDGMTLMGEERGTLEDYSAVVRHGRPGFVVYANGGRLWVFRGNSPALREYQARGEPAERITLIGRGPEGMTVMGVERDTLDAYVAVTRYSRPGFAVFAVDGRLWVFREGSEALAEYRSKGEPAERVSLIGRGPDGMTLLGPDRETIDEYLAIVRQ